MAKTDVLVIGGGPGGYTAAIRSAQLGKKTVLVEKNSLGGTCLNWGCIPTKVYLKAAELLHGMEKAKLFGIDVDVKNIDIEALRGRKEQIVKTLVGGVNGLLRANGVDIKKGSARFKNNKTVVIDSGEEIEASKIIIASGSENIKLNIPGIDLDGVITSDEALELQKVPRSVVIIGGGVIGMEFAEVYRSLGAEVTVLEALPRILPLQDADLGAELQKIYTQKGVNIHTAAKVTEIKESGTEKEVLFEKDNQKQSVKGEQVLVAVGRRPAAGSLDLEKAGIPFDKHGIKVDEKLQTSVPGIYAIGDVNGGVQLAHVAFYEGEKAAEHAAGQDVEVDYKVIPQCIYTIPEVASVGLTEQEVQEKGDDYRVGHFPFRANGKALLMEEAHGFIKIIADQKYDEILGVHMIGPAASELIVEAALAIKLECTVEEIIETIHAHPTVGESYREAAMDVFNRAIHFKS